MYAEQAAAGAGPEAAAQGGAQESSTAQDDNVVDAEFEEVKDDKK
jgi:molecular chaperone DnaK